MREEMLKDLQTLVECESPSSDLAACEKVLEVANQITTRVIGARQTHRYLATSCACV